MLLDIISMNKQYKMLKSVLSFYEEGSEALKQGADFGKLSALAVREEIGRYKYVTEDKVDEEFDRIKAVMEESIQALVGKEA